VTVPQLRDAAYVAVLDSERSCCGSLYNVDWDPDLKILVMLTDWDHWFHNFFTKVRGVCMSYISFSFY
jgi:hypothetical protein